MDKKKIERYKNFHGDIDQIPLMRKWVVDQLNSCNVGSGIINDIKIALTEALTNIYHHAYNDELVKPVRIKISVNAERVSVTLRDFGKKFDLTNYVSPDLSQPAGGGYGVYLIRQIMDGVEYISHDIGTELLMWKERRQKTNG